MNRHLTSPRLAALAASLVLAGCASFSGIEPQADMRSPDSVGLATGQTGPAFRAADDWWRAFGDDQLDALMTQALQGNPSLKIAQARLARAQAMSEAARANTLPQVNGSLNVTRQHFTKNGLYPPPIAGSTVNTGDLGLQGSWELDFFGKNAAALRAAVGATRAAEADAQAARVLLTTNVARAYLQLARTDDQLAVAQRTLEQRQQSLQLVSDRVRAGLDTSLELRQSEGSLPETRQQIEALREQATIAEHALAALTGAGNRDVVTKQPSLAQLKAMPVPTQLPSDLLGQRADIVAARWRVEAASQNVRSAKAQFYPSINIVGLVGLSSFGLGKLIDMGSTQWSLGPAIHLPIFDAGRLRANLRGNTADLDAAVESYNASVLDAIRDTADQLASAQSIARQQAEQAAAQQSAEAAYQISLERYKAGLGTYLNVLSAETGVLAQRRLAVDLAARAFDTQVALMRALGGGTSGAPASGASLAAASPAATPVSR
jgi:NodT family efflux transporter outer membrane factor (OMF) lipoprotein